MTLALDRLSLHDANELACRAHLGVWTEQKRRMVNGELHWEWSELAMTEPRLCVVAPREHAKSETFTINQVTWRCTYQPGIWCYVFAQTGDQAAELLSRIKLAMAETTPELIERPIKDATQQVVFANWSRVSVAGAGKGVRGAHPDLIIGDDVLEDGNTMTAHQRRQIERWWLGTIGGMSHPGTYRKLGTTGDAPLVKMPPTKVHLIGTPFHQQDLLMSMRDNPMYRFRRYAAEFKAEDLVDGLAVEVA